MLISIFDFDAEIFFFFLSTLQASKRLASYGCKIALRVIFLRLSGKHNLYDLILLSFRLGRHRRTKRDVR